MTPRRLWVTGVGTLVLVNGICWHKSTDDRPLTLCASTLRPALDAVPGSRWLLAAGLAAFHRHLRPTSTTNLEGA